MYSQGFVEERGENNLSQCLCAGCVVPGARRRGARVFFAIQTTDAESVWVVGSFNSWQETHPMVKSESGIWETSLRLSEISDGDTYKFKICAGGREIYVTDPYALENDGPPHFNSVYRDISDELSHTYDSEEHVGCLGMPVNIYELRADKWSQDKKALHYGDIAREILPYVLQMGYTHVCLAGIFEDYYDHAHAHGEHAYFAPHKEQGGIVELRELVHAIHASGIGVLLDWKIDALPDDVTGESFLIDNALYWINVYGIDGFVIGSGDGVDEDALSRIIHALKSEKTEAYFIARDMRKCACPTCTDTAVKDCDAYCYKFASPKNEKENLRMKMAARAYLAFMEGRMTTHMGCDIGQARWDAEENGIDPRLSDKSDNAMFQLYVSDLNSIYLSYESLWRCDRRVRVITDGVDRSVAVIECACDCDTDRLLLAVDLLGNGGNAYIPDEEGLSVLICSQSQRYGGDGKDPVSQGALGVTVSLSAYGAVVLGRAL